MNYGNKNDELFQNDALVNDIGRYGPGKENFSSYQLNKTSGIADFDILQSSFPLSPSDQDHFFLTSAINWEPANTRKISIKMNEIEKMYQIINTHFNLNVRPC